MQSRSVFARLTAGALCVVMGGCALTSPLRGPTPSVVAEDRAEDSLKSARALAQDMADVYWKSAKAHSHAKTALATALPIINVGALYHAQTHPDPGNDFLAVAGYGSALGLTLGSLLISPERQRVYLAGQAAALCALHRTDGYDVESQLEPYLAFDGGEYGAALREARAAKPEVDSLYSAVAERKKKAVEAAAPADDMRKAAKTRKLGRGETRSNAIADAEAKATRLENAVKNHNYASQVIDEALVKAKAAIDAAKATRQGLREFESRRRGAGQALRADIDGIRGAVDIQVLRTEPDVKQIRASLSATALASLRGSGTDDGIKSQGRTNLPDTVKLQGVLSAEELNALTELRQATNALVLQQDQAAEALAVLLTGENKAAQNRACSVANVNGLVVYPPSQALIAGGEVLAIVVRASEPPIATIEGADDGLSVVEVVVTTGSLYKIRIKADATATAGDRNLLVVAGGESQPVKFEVDAAPPKTPDSVTPPKDGKIEPDPEAKGPAAALGGKT